MKMTILERDDGVTHIVLTGRLDTTGTEEIEEAFCAATALRKRPTVVDISEIDFHASRGIGLLFANGKNLLRCGQKMVLLNPRGIVASVLATSKVDRILPIASDLPQAIQILTGAAAESAAQQEQTEPEAEQLEEPVRQLRQGRLKLSINNALSELEGLNAKLAEFLKEHGVPRRPTYAINLAID